MNKNMQIQTKINAVINITLTILFLNYRGLQHFSISERKPVLFEELLQIYFMITLLF